MRRRHLYVAPALILAVAMALTGCPDAGTKPPDSSTPTASGHPTEGPHHGHLIELGNEEYHAELLHDDDTNTVTIYILDGSAKQEVAIAQETVTINLVIDGSPRQFSLAAVAVEAGKTSQFALIDADLLAALESEENVSGKLSVTIDGKPYLGTIDHAAHGHDHGHNH